MNEFYWAIMGLGEMLVPMDDPPLCWLTKQNEMEHISIDDPNVRLFDTEREANIFIYKFFRQSNFTVQKVHKDFIYV